MRSESGHLIRRERCEECALDKLDAAVSANSILQRAIDIDFATSAGFRVTLDEIDVEEFNAIKVLRSERNKYESEQMKNPKTR